MDEITKNMIANLKHELMNEIKDIRRDNDENREEIKDLKKELVNQNNRVTVLEQAVFYTKDRVDQIAAKMGKFEWLIISSVIIAVLNLIVNTP